MVFDDGGAAIHPVAAIDIDHAIDRADCGAVDVAADHAVQPALAHGANQRILEVEDERNGSLDAVLGITGKGPIAGAAQQAAQARERGVEAHQQVVADVADHCQPAVVARHLVELVAMQQQVAPAVGGDVDVLAPDFDVAEGNAVVFAHRLVVVAGDQHHALAVAGAAQDLLHHGVLRRGPMDAAIHRPEVDDVADQKQVLAFVVSQEVEQTVRLAAASAQMDVGNEDRANVHGLCLVG